MYGRNRSPVTGNMSSPVTGNRSGSMGIGGVATASRERFARGRDEYRNYGRVGFGRGQSKQVALPQGNEIFMEAGRLAAEYLVSKGVLPPSALSGKLQNGSLKNAAGADFMRVPVEGRISALPRLGNAPGDVGHGRKRFLDEYNSLGSRSLMRERRRNGAVRNYGSEFNRELERIGSWNRARASPDVDGQDNTFSGNRDEQQVAKDSDGALQNSPPRKINPEMESLGDSPVDSKSADENKSGDDVGKKASSVSTGNDIPSEGEQHHNEKFGETESTKIEADQVDVSSNNDDLERKAAEEDTEVKLSTDDHKQTAKSSNDVLSEWTFENVPKKTRSSLVTRDMKVCDNAVIEDENSHEGELPEEIMHSKLNPVDVPPGVMSSLHSHDAQGVDSDKSEPLALEEESCGAHAIKQVNETSSSSFVESMVIKEDEKIEGLPEFERCTSINLERGEKRALHAEDDCMEVNKRPRELASSVCALSDGFLYRSGSTEKWQNSQKPGTSHGDAIMFASDDKMLVDISPITKDDVEPGADFTEKQLFPRSLKTCDLNLMEASDLDENHNTDPLHIFPGITGSVKQETPVDIDLTMGSNCHLPSNYAKSGFDGRDIEVIDLENDSEQEEKALNNPERRSEIVFTGSDGFSNNPNGISNNPHGSNNIPDVQDGYGLMISELLGNDIPSCSSVPANMNSLHNDMGLHNGEGMLGDDDSIYMSLGEIPISFLSAWEQQTQDFGKPF